MKLGNFQKSKNKFKDVYVLTPQGIAEKAQLSIRFLSRKIAEYEALKAEIESFRAEAMSFVGGGLMSSVRSCNDAR